MKLHFSRELRESAHAAALSGFFWFAWAFSIFQTIYLQGEGFSATQIGVLNAIMAALCILSTSFWGMLSDKIGSVKKVELMLLFVGCGLYALVPLIRKIFGAAAVLPYFLYLPLVNLFRAPQSTFHENLLVRNCSEQRLHYGRLRSAGSVMYAVSSLIVAHYLPVITPKNTFWLTGIMMIPAIILTASSRDPHVASTPPLKAARSEKKSAALNESRLFRSHEYVIFLIYTFLLYVAIHFEGSFITFFLEEIGAPSSSYSLFMGYRAVLEIPFLIFSPQLMKKFKLKSLTALVGLFMGIETLLIGLYVESFPGLVASATFFGLGNGLLIFSSANYLYEISPDDLKASAQAFYAAVCSIAGILANFLGGFLYDAMGSHPFYLVTAGIYFLSVLVFVAIGRKKRPCLPENG